MIENILSSKSRWAILRALMDGPDRPFVLQDLVGRTGLSTGTLHPSLQALVSSGMIVTQKYGRSLAYSLNRQSVLYQPIRHLLLEERKALENIALDFADAFPKPLAQAIILFGSLARGEFDVNSDIDIVLIGKDKKQLTARAHQVADALLQKHEIPVSPLILSISEFERRRAKRDLFVETLLDEGKWLRGRPWW